MLRRYVILATGIALQFGLVGCAAHSAKQAKQASQTQDVEFTTEEQKILACLDLQDHIVDLYASEYVSREGVAMSAAERTAFRDGWAEELAKRGTFERFEQSCFYGLTRRRYQCGMQSQTTGGLVACMRLSMR
ncbi:MAG TPA: hypothetical protein VKU41_14980 [Polyangiaceae bacterium]|nr:hypothetical protein [Polyangiaceae bacterium]